MKRLLLAAAVFTAPCAANAQALVITQSTPCGDALPISVQYGVSLVPIIEQTWIALDQSNEAMAQKYGMKNTFPPGSVLPAFPLLNNNKYLGEVIGACVHHPNLALGTVAGLIYDEPTWSPDYGGYTLKDFPNS